MGRPRICAVIVSNEPETIKAAAPLVDLFEVRIDLIGDGWQKLAKKLKKPWIASNRIADEGGKWQGSESERINMLLKAVELGAEIVDIELRTEDLTKAVKRIKEKAKCLLSFHDFKRTPSLRRMREIVQSQLYAGADICKVVTTANSLEDNLSVLKLVSDFPQARVVSFAMGPLGLTSRILCPLVGGEFTYASMEEGKESAPGQITASDLRKIYRMLKNGR